MDMGTVFVYAVFYVVIFAFPLSMIGLILYFNRETAKNRGGWRAVTVMAGIDALALGIAVWVICGFDFVWFNRAMYIAMAVVIELVLIGWMTHRLNKKTVPVLLILLALCVCGRLGSVAFERYAARIQLPESFDAYRYLPFEEDSLVKTLDEPSALKLSDGLPRMDGATALYPVYAAFAQAVYPEAMWDMTREERWEVIHCSTTPNAYRKIVDGQADIIFAAGPSPEQEQYARNNDVELIYTPIGREAFVFFVNPKNTIEGLTLDQIRGIYSGRITAWSALGVKGLGSIRAFQRSRLSGSQTALEKLMGDTPLMEPPSETRIGSMWGIVKVASDYQNFRNAIGFSFRFYCTELVPDLQVKLLAVNGVAPTRENIENGAYPLASYFYAVTRGDADENTRALLAWIQGPQGQELIDKTGYTPVNAQ